MRVLFLTVAAAALALSGCGKHAQTESNQAGGASLSAENIVSNDVTAIDAVTGDAANMAADVDMNYGNMETNGTTPVTSSAPAPSTPRTKASAKPASTTPSATTNTTAAATNAE